MKTLRKLTGLLILAIVSIYTFTACGDDDDKNQKDAELAGRWRLMNAAPDVEPLSGKESDEIRLEDSLSNYTFFAPYSEIVFQNDSVRLTADFMGYQLPLHMPYHYKKDILTIATPLNLPFVIQGSIEQKGDVMEFELTTESYMSILQFIHPPFLNEILSATVEYDIQRIH